jgi:hypothetical protein
MKKQPSQVVYTRPASEARAKLASMNYSAKSTAEAVAFDGSIGKPGRK